MNTSEHLCRRAIAIVRRHRAGATVDPHDIAFVQSHLTTCPRCQADSAVIRGMTSYPAEARFDEVTKRRLTGAVLAEAARQRIEDEEAPVEVKNRRFVSPVAAAAAIAALALLGLYLVSPRAPVPLPPTSPNQIAASSGRGTRVQTAPSPTDLAEHPVKPAVSIAAPAVMPSIRTAAKPRTILMSTGIKLLVGQASELSVRRSDEAAITVALGQGEILASVDPNRHGPPFAVETALGKVVVKGTIFAVTADGAKGEVTVLRGRVAVMSPDGTEQLVDAGERLCLADHRRKPLVDAARENMVEEASRLAIVDETTQELVDWRWHQAGRAVKVDAADARTALSPPPAPTAPVKPTSAEANPAKPTIRALSLDIREYRMAQAWTKAADAYQLLIDTYPASEEAASALVALGDMRLNKLGQAEAALALFDRYLYGHGETVMEEALVGKAAALRKLGRLREEEAVLERFLSRFPKSIHTPSAEDRLNDLKKISKPGAPTSDVTGTQRVKEQ